MTDPKAHQAGGISEAQGARLEERIHNLGDLLREVREDQKKTNESLSSVIGIQRDVLHVSSLLATVDALGQRNQKDLEAIGRHVAVVSMWGKVAFAVMSLAITGLFVGVWNASSLVGRLNTIDSRLTGAETVLQSTAIKSTFEGPNQPDPGQAPAPAPAPTKGRR